MLVDSSRFMSAFTLPLSHLMSPRFLRYSYNWGQTWTLKVVNVNLSCHTIVQRYHTLAILILDDSSGRPRWKWVNKRFISGEEPMNQRLSSSSSILTATLLYLIFWSAFCTTSYTTPCLGRILPPNHSPEAVTMRWRTTRMLQHCKCFLDNMVLTSGFVTVQSFGR